MMLKLNENCGDIFKLSALLQGLFARRRMFLLTTGPHLYYVDPVNKVLKGEVPLTSSVRPDPKNFKTFFVHTVSWAPVMGDFLFAC